MRRKLTAALLTAAMAISLTACGGSGDTASAGASTGETASVTEAGGTTTASGKEVLRVAMSADYAPFDWLQEDDSNGAVMTSNGSYMNGYDVLVAKYIAEKLDMDLEITQIDWDGLILSIQSGKVDCAIAGMSITSERSQSVDFSDPYYNANIVAVVAADGPYADAVNVTDFEGGTGFEVSNEETDLGIPCQKGNTELVDKINEVLAGLSQEDRDAMMDQAVASQPVSN